MKKTFTYLIAAVAFMLISTGAMAQGGLTPLVGSTHDYTVTPEDINNTLLWSVTPASGTGGYTINSQSVSGLTSVANITWNTAGTYTLQFEETNSDGCITLKQESVVVSTNTFDVSTTDPDATCNALDGTVNPSGNATTSITFKVDMVTGDAGWNPAWEIDFTLTPAGTATITNVSVTGGTLTGA